VPISLRRLNSASLRAAGAAIRFLIEYEAAERVIIMLVHAETARRPPHIQT
jgi:hypothetical protein